MSLENAKVLHKHFLEIGLTHLAEQQEKNYPELKTSKEKPEPSKPKAEEKPKEVKKDDKKQER